VPAGTLTWRGMTEGIGRLKDSLKGLTDRTGREPVFTWLLRVDEQIQRVHGEYGWVLRAHRALLESLESSGDELGWHPHFWRYDERQGHWFQEVGDVGWQVEMLKNAHRDYVSVFPGRARSVRMGWDYHNNRTYQTLEDLGVTVDFSAIPGLRTTRGGTLARSENIFDWYPTPRQPFKPSRADYRRPARAGESTSALLEAPNFVSTSLFWGLISGLQFARKMKDPGQLWQAIRRPTYWINITGRPNLFAPLVTQLKRSLRHLDSGGAFFVTYFHPDELLPNRSSLYNLESVRTNLASILQACSRYNVEPEFIRATQIPTVWTDAWSPGSKQELR